MENELFDQYPKETLERFKIYHADNPHIYLEFRRLAMLMKETGKKKYSAEAIVNAIRWEYDLKTSGDVFEINNDFRSIYARLLIHNHPEFENFFELRKAPNKGLKSSEQVKREIFLGRQIAG